MEKQAPNHKHKKKPSQPKREGLKQKALKWKKNPQIKKTKKKNHTLNPTDLDQRQSNSKRRPKSKKKKNSSYPKPDGLKPNAIKWKKSPK